MLEKREIELTWQKQWAPTVHQNLRKIREYWEKYRRLDDILSLIRPTDIVYDIGCGVSSVLLFIEAETKIGFDPLVDEYKKIYDYPFDVKCIRSEDMTSEPQADIVFCTNCLDHVENPLAALRNCWSLVKNGGTLILTVEVDGSKNDPAHPHRWTFDEIHSMMGGLPGVNNATVWVSPWIGVQRYCQGRHSKVANEYCTIIQKNQATTGVAEYIAGEALFTKAKAAEAAGNLENARQLYQAAVAAAPDNLTFFRASCQLLFWHGSLIEAEAALLQLTQRQPDDPSAHHNLATVYVRMKHDRAAERAYRESLRLRPDSAPTLQQLAYVLQRLHRSEEAKALLKQSESAADVEITPSGERSN